MSHLDVMLSMDSANMHLASLVNTPVVPFGEQLILTLVLWAGNSCQSIQLQLDLSCRPCSVYGQKPCFRGDYACMRNIKPEQIISKVEGLLMINRKSKEENETCHCCSLL